VLIVLCFAIQLSCEPESEALNRWRYNFIGGMLPFGFGVLYARYAHAWTTATNLVAFVLSLFAILLMSFNYITWYFVPLVICVASITFVRLSLAFPLGSKARTPNDKMYGPENRRK